ncbi:MAG: NAD(P)-dependent oxidoreductase [Endomicrobiales bacterium]|jgi:nucleoside-diphosphate-sugar epimerase
MKVLVTGANGFVGSHIVEAVIAAGHQAVCQVRRTSDLTWLKDLPVEYRFGDLTNAEILPEIVQGIDAIIHCAAVVSTPECETYYTVNQHATRKLAEAAYQHNLYFKRFIFISSQAAMGPSVSLIPKKSDARETPVSDYGKSKLAAERDLIAMQDKLRYTILRPASVYGPRDKSLFIIFNLINWRIRPTPTTSRYVQLCFVTDLAQAAVRSLETDCTINKTYIVAEKTPYLWSEITALIATHMRKKTIRLPVADCVLRLTGFCAENIAKYQGKCTIVNHQKVEEMLHQYWVGEVTDTYHEMGIDFTNLAIGCKITYSCYKVNGWL